MLGFASFSIVAAVPLSAQETITYTYDALGRLVQVNHGTAGPNANVVASYAYDKADNRCNVTVSTTGGSGAGTCTGGGTTTLTLSPISLPSGTVGTGYNSTISASGGNGSYTFTTSTGAIPAGLTLSSAGVLSGTPTTASSYSFTITATDSAGDSGSRAYSVTIGAASQPPVANPDFASTTVCGTVTVNVVANDTDPGGNYPLQLTGIVSSTMGTPTIVSSTSIEFDAFGRTGTGTVTYTVANSKGATANGTLSVTISGGTCQ
jgi:hypothetical protein